MTHSGVFQTTGFFFQNNWPRRKWPGWCVFSGEDDTISNGMLDVSFVFRRHVGAAGSFYPRDFFCRIAGVPREKSLGMPCNEEASSP